MRVRAGRETKSELVCYNFLHNSGVVQLVARQPLELVILVRVQAPEPNFSRNSKTAEPIPLVFRWEFQETRPARFQNLGAAPEQSFEFAIGKDRFDQGRFFLASHISSAHRFAAGSENLGCQPMPAKVSSQEDCRRCCGTF